MFSQYPKPAGGYHFWQRPFMTSTRLPTANAEAFFRKSFKAPPQRQYQNLVIDVRNNGGGNVGLSTMLTQLHHRPTVQNSRYTVCGKEGRANMASISRILLESIDFMNFITKNEVDGKYHFGYFERHYFKPRRNIISMAKYIYSPAAIHFRPLRCLQTR